MFDKVGGKIKVLAQVYAILGIVISLIVSVCMVVIFKNLIISLGIAVGGFLFFWISSLFIYGFGQLIENSDEMVSLQVDAWGQREEYLLLELKKQGKITEEECDQRMKMIEDMFQ